jgi:hypothetical protein
MRCTYKPARFRNEPGFHADREQRLIADREKDVREQGYALISHHDSVTGRAELYLRKDWLSSPDRRLFQRIGAPRQGLGRTAVGSVVRFALERSGVQSNTRGSHQFRHTIACKRRIAGGDRRGASARESGHNVHLCEG